MLSEATVGAMGTLLKVVIDNVQQAALFSSDVSHQVHRSHVVLCCGQAGAEAQKKQCPKG